MSGVGVGGSYSIGDQWLADGRVWVHRSWLAETHGCTRASCAVNGRGDSLPTSPQSHSIQLLELMCYLCKFESAPFSRGVKMAEQLAALSRTHLYRKLCTVYDCDQTTDTCRTSKLFFSTWGPFFDHPVYRHQVMRMLHVCFNPTGVAFRSWPLRSCHTSRSAQ